MSKHKSNVNPGQYKVAGRERQGEDVIQERNKALLAQSRAQLEQHKQYPERLAPTEGKPMPEQETLERARRDKAEGKSLSTQPARDTAKRRHPGRKPSATRSRAVRKALRGEGHSAASRGSLATQARASARRRTATQRSAAARKAARTRARD
jgi:hypothetical protein